MAGAYPVRVMNLNGAAEDAYQSLFQNAVEGIFQTLPGGYYLNVNPALARIYGYEGPEDLMNGITDIAGQLYVDPGRRDDFMNEMRESGSVRDFESRIHCKDGSIKWISENARAVYNGKDLVYYEGFVVDISERKLAEEARARLEAELARTQRMSSLGALSRGIAHDFKTFLSVIEGYTELAQGGLKQGYSVEAYLERIHLVIDRANAMVERIQTLGRATETPQEPVRMDLLVDDVVRMLRASLAPSIEVVLRLDAPEGRVLADPTQLVQLIINLCTNAFRAMGETGGQLTVELGVVQNTPPFVMAGLAEGEYLRLTIRDNGCGMDPDVTRVAFEESFTTKEGLGSGFGLGIVEGIVKGLNGALSFDSVPGEGTTFDILLPLHEAE